MKIIVQNLRSQVVEATDEEERLVARFLRVQSPKYWFSSAYQRGRWDGNVDFFSPRTKKFPTGLLPHLQAKLTSAAISTSFVDERPPVRVAADVVLHGITLRDYQHESITATLTNRCGSLWFPRGLIQLPTASGKTAILAALAKSVSGVVLVLTHRTELMHQTRERLAEYLGETVGSIGDGTEVIGRVTVATVQTLATRVKGEYKNPVLQEFLLRVDAILIDEAHHTAAEQFTTVLDRCPATMRVGVSATPFRNKDDVQRFKVMGQLGYTLIHKTPGDLVERHAIAPTTVYYAKLAQRPTFESASGMELAPWTFTWPHAYTGLVVSNPYRNDAIVAWVRARVVPTLVIVTRIAHGEILSDLLGVPFIHGGLPSKTRLGRLAELRGGKIKTLIISTIGDEGLDIVNVRRVVLAGGHKAEGPLLQRIGRGMRREKDTDTLEVLDFFDSANKHLHKHTQERIAAVAAAGFAMELVAFDGTTFASVPLEAAPKSC